MLQASYYWHPYEAAYSAGDIQTTLESQLVVSPSEGGYLNDVRWISSIPKDLKVVRTENDWPVSCNAADWNYAIGPKWKK